jgi:hypothetical protein
VSPAGVLDPPPHPDWRRGLRHAVVYLLALVVSEGALYAVLCGLLSPRLQAWQWITISLISASIPGIGFLHGAFRASTKCRTGDGA